MRTKQQVGAAGVATTLACADRSADSHFFMNAEAINLPLLCYPIYCGGS